MIRKGQHLEAIINIQWKYGLISKKPLKSLPAKSMFIALAILTTIIRPLLSQELHFFKEKITIEIQDEHCVLLGEYLFENSSNTSLTRALYYPVVVNESLHFPHFFEVKNSQLNKEIPFTVSKNGFFFSIKISPHDITSYQVEYHQKTTRRVFEYVLKSTHSWQVPIDSAEIVIAVPKKFKLQSISIPYDRVINQKDRLKYLITRENFYPNENMLIKWGSM